MGTNCCDVCVILEKCLHSLDNDLPIYEQHVAGKSLAACEYNSMTEYYNVLTKLRIEIKE